MCFTTIDANHVKTEIKHSTTLMCCAASSILVQDMNKIPHIIDFAAQTRELFYCSHKSISQRFVNSQIPFKLHLHNIQVVKS